MTAAQRTGTTALSTESIFHQRPESREAVAPGDLLALVELAPGVRDRDLVDADAPAQDLCGDLGLDVEVIRAQVELGDEVGVNELVARLHVGKRGVVEDVRC